MNILIIEKNIKLIISELLNVEIEKLKNSSGPMKDILEWDSMAHLRILMQIESFFQIKFEIEEMESIKNIQDIIELIKLKI